MKRRTISLISLGGTISGVPHPTGGARPGLVAADLLESAPLGVDVTPIDGQTISSRNITPYDIWSLSETIDDQVAKGAEGIVVTHGTDTMEETAYGLALTLSQQVPIILTGAMRGWHLPGADGAANVAAAVYAALEPALAQYGPVIVFGDEIHVASLVTKTHSSRLAAFSSPAAGPVGHITEDRVELFLGPPPFPPTLYQRAKPDSRVAIIAAAVGVDAQLLHSAVETNDGVVISGLGGGHLPTEMAHAAASHAMQGYPIVLASRCTDPDILAATYSGVGSEKHLLDSGLVPAGHLSPPKARLRLLFGLSAGLDPRELFPSHQPTERR